MLLPTTKISISVSGAARPKRRGRLTPVRRARRLVAGLCAGAALLGGSLSAFGQQTVAPVGYNANLRGHGGQRNCVPSCPTYSYPCTPNYYSPYYQEGAAPTDAPPREGEAGEEGQAGQEGQPGSPGAADGMNAPNAPPPVAAAPVAASVSGATGSSESAQSAAPNAIGDMYSAVTSRHGHGPILDDRLTAGGPFYVPNPAQSVVGLIKASENNSPIPRDRFFFDYAAYDNVPLGGTASYDVQRYVPGLERTFLDQMASVEVRMPFAQTLSHNYVDGAGGGDDWEPGNLYVAVKGLLYQDDQFGFTSGLGISTPTGNDSTFRNFAGTETGEVENTAVHLLPYFALLHTPNETIYSQTYIQVDCDANGNSLRMNGTDRGIVQDQTRLYGDFILGGWLWDDPNSSGLTGIVGASELHYSTAIQDYHSINDASTSLTAPATDDYDFLTGMLGVHLLYAGGTQVTFAYGVPLLSQRFADSEFRMMINLGSPFGALGALAGVPTR